eukprot:2905464-Amphidinium_carterae.2
METDPAKLLPLRVVPLNNKTAPSNFHGVTKAEPSLMRFAPLSEHPPDGSARPAKVLRRHEEHQNI